MKTKLKIAIYLASFMLSVHIATAQPSDFTISKGNSYWQVPNLNCNEGILCKTSITPAGNIYTVDTTNHQLYVSIRNEDHYTQYDLQAMSTFMNGFRDFVPVDGSSKIVFASDTGSAAIGAYDMATRSFTQLDLSQYGRIKSCNNYLSAIIVPQGYILPIGIGSQFIFCSFGANNKLTVHIYDVSNNQVQNLDFGAKGIGDNRLGKPWNSLIGGQDGNLYIEVFGSENFLEGLVPSPIILAPRDRALVKYAVATGTWSFQTITADQMFSSAFLDSRFLINARTISVDTNGNSYFYFEPPGMLPVMEFTLMNLDSNALYRLTSADFTQQMTLVGVTQDGLVLLIGEKGLSSLSLEQISDHPIENHPTVTSAVG